MSKRADAVIVAAGSGSRSGLNVPKQFYEINGRPVLAYTIERFLSCESIANVAVVLPRDGFESNVAYMQGFFAQAQDRIIFTIGGATRMESVYNGLCVLGKNAMPIVCIHDGVRPFVTDDIINESIDCAEEHGAALAAVQITDTVKQVCDGIVEATLDRSKLYAAQTPQTFGYKLIMNAYARAISEGKQFTDDCAVAEYSGAKIHITKGSTRNIKLTVPEDFERLQ